MPFRLRSTESVADGLRRIARAELSSISTRLESAAPPRRDTIHEIRKSVKKTDAILQVVVADGGRGFAKSAKRLHVIHARLSALRDADVVLETLRILRNRNPGILNQRCVGRLRRRLSSHKRSLMKAARRKATWQRVSKSVRRIRRNAKHWNPRHRQFRSLAAGIRLAHQRGRTAMARARKSQRAGDFHDWRKQIKTLWYELRLLEGSGPRIRRDVKALHRVEVWLGNEHDVVMLSEELSKDKSRGDISLDLDRIRLVGDSYRAELRAKALACTRGIFARTSRDYVDSVRREWQRWHTRQEGTPR